MNDDDLIARVLDHSWALACFVVVACLALGGLFFFLVV